MREKSKGLVMETLPEGLVILLTPKGEFIQVSWSPDELPDIGSEVEFLVPGKSRWVSRVLARAGLVACAACLVLAFFFASLWSEFLSPASRSAAVAAAYISVDINPSLELCLNKKGNVIEAIGLNEDGNTLLQGMELKGHTAREALELITDAAVLAQYLAPDKDNTVLITVSGETITPDLEDLDRQVTENLEKKNIKARSEQYIVSLDMREKAKRLELSPAKYLILLEAKEAGLALTQEDLKENSIVKAVKKAGGDPGELISRAHNNSDSPEDVKKVLKDKQKEPQGARDDKIKTEENIKSKKNKEEKDNQGKGAGKKPVEPDKPPAAKEDSTHDNNEKNPNNNNDKEANDKRTNDEEANNEEANNDKTDKKADKDAEEKTNKPDHTSQGKPSQENMEQEQSAEKGSEDDQARSNSGQNNSGQSSSGQSHSGKK